jgi:hypothetical protein
VRAKRWSAAVNGARATLRYSTGPPCPTPRGCAILVTQTDAPLAACRRRPAARRRRIDHGSQSRPDLVDFGGGAIAESRFVRCDTVFASRAPTPPMPPERGRVCIVMPDLSGVVLAEGWFRATSEDGPASTMLAARSQVGARGLSGNWRQASFRDRRRRYIPMRHINLPPRRSADGGAAAQRMATLAAARAGRWESSGAARGNRPPRRHAGPDGLWTFLAIGIADRFRSHDGLAWWRTTPIRPGAVSDRVTVTPRWHDPRMVPWLALNHHLMPRSSFDTRASAC